VVGLHSHLLGVPLAAHVAGAVQVPQSSEPPQPSSTKPHSAPSAVHVLGEHPQMFASPPPPQDAGAVHVLPQSSIDPQLSGIIPQFLPCIAQVVGLQPQ
jgi:hypothetical protein